MRTGRAATSRLPCPRRLSRGALDAHRAIRRFDDSARHHAYLDRLNRREADRDTPVTPTAAAAQLHAIREWGEIPTTDRYAMLATIKQPTLIVHGAKDIVVDSVNAIVLEENLCDARLLMLGSKVTQVQLNSLFAELSSLADKVSPFVAYCHLRRAAEHLA
jgi:pimeloyl-ACP methyl ester carboxylesterase